MPTFRNVVFTFSLALLPILSFVPNAYAGGDDDGAEAGEDTGDDTDPSKNAKVIEQVFSDAKAACSKIRKDHVPTTVVDCVKSVDVKELTAALKNLRNYWNSSIASNGRLTLGPREIEFGSTQTGALFHHAQRRFIGLEPLTKDSVNVVVVKQKGRAGGSVEACLQAEGGQVTCKTASFGKGRHTESKSITFDKALGKVLLVRVQGDGKLLQKFGYSLRVN